MLIISFIIFLFSILGIFWMVYRMFPELAHVSIVQHKKFSFFGIEEIHILQYKHPSEVLKKNIYVFFEKTLRRIRFVILKLDNILSKNIEKVQQKNQALDVSEAHKIRDIVER